MANVNRQIIERLSAAAPVHAIDSGPGPSRSRAGANATRLWRILCGPIAMTAARLKGARTFYGSVDDGWGGLSTALFALTARCLFANLLLHHHSFRYLNGRSRLMSLVVLCAGGRCQHVHLCHHMAARFTELYGCAGRTIVVPNPVVVEDRRPPRHEGTGLVIGMLSNLMFEKGIDEFVALLEAARCDGLEVSGILAGPAWDKEAQTFLSEAVERNTGALEWLGPVFGVAKEQFFAKVDLFVFPTRYPTEAYPLVLVEALVRGCAILTRDQGCIGALRHLESVEVAGAAENFTAIALDRLRAEVGRDASERRARASQEGAVLNATNLDAQTRLIAMLTAAD